MGHWLAQGMGHWALDMGHWEEGLRRAWGIGYTPGS